MAAKYYTSLDEEALEEAMSAAETLLDFFYNRHSRFGVDNRTANRCAAHLREISDLLGQVQIVSDSVERTRRVQLAWE